MSHITDGFGTPTPQRNEDGKLQSPTLGVYQRCSPTSSPDPRNVGGTESPISQSSLQDCGGGSGSPASSVASSDMPMTWMASTPLPSGTNTRGPRVQANSFPQRTHQAVRDLQCRENVPDPRFDVFDALCVLNTDVKRLRELNKAGKNNSGGTYATKAQQSFDLVDAIPKATKECAAACPNLFPLIVFLSMSKNMWVKVLSACDNCFKDALAMISPGTRPLATSIRIERRQRQKSNVGKNEELTAEIENHMHAACTVIHSICKQQTGPDVSTRIWRILNPTQSIIATPLFLIQPSQHRI